MTAAAQELLDALLPGFCEGCGEQLPEAGMPCAACGTVPQMTRAEAAERLAQPGAIAVLEAARERGEARRLADEAAAHYAAADMIEHADRLERTRDEAAALIPPARGEAMRLARELRKAQARELEAQAREEDARRNFATLDNAEEAARRCGAGAAARTRALVDRNAAAAILEGDQAALRTATAVREEAERAAAATRAKVAALDAALKKAQQAADNPGWPGRSVITLAADLPRHVMAGDLTESEQAVVRALGEALAGYTGAATGIARRAAEIAVREHEDRDKRSARFLRPAGNGATAVQTIPAGTRGQVRV